MKTRIALAVSAGLLASSINATEATQAPQQVAIKDGLLTPYLQQFESVAVSSSGPKAFPRVQLGSNENRRYIVELQSPSLLTFQAQQLKREHPTFSIEDVRQSSTFKAATADYMSRLEAEQTSAWNSLRNVSPKLSLLNSFKRVNNALIVEGNPAMLEAVERLPNVKRVVEESYVYKALDTSVPLVRAPEVWSMTDANDNALLGTGITVAIIDTGIDYTHPALGGCFGPDCKVTAGYDFHYGDADPMDVDGHGTHVAGIVAANSDTLKGVAPEAKLHAYKALSDQGFGSNVDIIAAVERAVDPDQDPLTDDSVDVINMSLGGGGGENEPLSLAVDAAVDAGVIVVVAAGNGGSYDDIPNTSPASARKAITVASSTKDDALSGFSSKGSMTATGNLKPEITAPGSDIVSSLPNNATGSLSGTSMAAPHVAGAAALLKQAYPELSVDAIKSKLMAGTIDIGEDPFAQGAGRMDIVAAMQSEIVASAGFVNFGKVDNDATEWSQVSSLLVENLSEEAATLVVTLPEGLPAGVAVTTDQNELIVEANSQASLDLTITIDDVAALPDPSNGAMVFFDTLSLESPNHTLTVPVVVEKSNELLVSHDSDVPAFVYLVNNEEQFFRIVALNSNQSKTVKVPAISLTATSEFGFSFADSAFLNNSGLPENALVVGYEMQSIDVTEDTELVFSTTTLDQFMGYERIVDQEDNPITIDFNGSMVSASIEHNNTTHSYWIFGAPHPILAMNTLPDNSRAHYVFAGQIESEDTPDVLENFIISTFADMPGETPSLFTFDLDTATQFEVSFAPNLTPENHVVNRMVHDVYGGGLGIALDTEATEFKFYKMNKTFDDGMVELNVSTRDDYYAQYSSERIATSDNGTIAKVVRDSQAVIDLGTESLSVGLGSTYWTADVSASAGNMSFYTKSMSFDRSFIHDIAMNNFDVVANPALHWLCDNTPTEVESMRAANFTQHTVPELNCSDMQLVIEFDSALNGTVYRSHMRQSLLDPQDFYVPALRYIGLMKNGQRVSDQVVNKINPQIEIHLEDYLVETLVVDVQLGDQDWQPAAVSIDPSSTGKAYASLPMFRGEEIANVRIAYGFDGYITEQLLNGFMLIGADASGGNDVDDDGIENDLDTDHDNDGTENDLDAFPFDSTEDTDTDSDGIGNNADEDDDNDGVVDAEDAFPLDPTESVDTDGDGIGNNADDDDDNDGTVDTEDAFPLDPTETVDTDGDGVGNNADNDDDNDGVVDANDAFPLDPSRSAAPQPVTPSTGSSGGGASSPIAILTLLLSVFAVRRKRAKRA